MSVVHAGPGPRPGPSIRRSSYQSSEASRQSILDALEAEPGLTRMDLVKATGRSWSDVSHHVRRMLALQQVRAVAIGRRHFYHLAGQAEQNVRLAIVLRREPAAAHLIRFLYWNGAAATRDLRQALGIEAKALRRTLQRLMSAGIVQAQPGLHTRYELAAVPLALSLWFRA